jgi:WD40 repeat protein
MTENLVPRYAVSVFVALGRGLGALAILAVLYWASGDCRAQYATPELPSEPILRIETQHHAAVIRAIDSDGANRFAVTASYDKTARVWSIADGRPLRVLRLPIDQGDIGKAYAVAISPDGATVAVGGDTGPADHHNIFLFDRASGELKQRIKDLTSAVRHLAYSPDGRLLVATLPSGLGIRVFDIASGYRPLPSDSNYHGHSYWAAFDRSGRLVTTSYEGLIRLYAADHYDAPIARYRRPNPYSVAFSPDGTEIAAGFDDASEVVVLSATDLTEMFKAAGTGLPSGGVAAVAWSTDGRFLLAAGRPEFTGTRHVRRWSSGGRGAFVDIPAGNTGSMQGVLGLADGRTLFSYQDHLGVIQADGKLAWTQGLGGLDLRSGRGPLRVSRNGDTVQVDSWDPPHSYRFALDRRQIDIDPPSDASLIAAATQAPGLSVTNWQGSTSPALNGAPLKLWPGETARSLALVPGATGFVLGANWSLRLFDQAGHEVWPAQPAPAEAWEVNVSADGRLIVAAFGDGTIRWYRMSDGQEVLALFIHPDGNRWIAWTPQGYYDASAGADNLIGWHINHGYDRAPDFYPVSQFRERFYRPDVIKRVLRTPNLDVAEAVREADEAAQAAGRSMTKAVSVQSLLKPVVEIDDPKDPVRQDHQELSLTYTVKLPSADGSLRVEAQVDGVKVASDDHRLVDTGDTRAGTLHITIPRRDATISVIGYNSNGAGVPALLHVQWTGAGTEPKLTLYVVAVGVSHYKDEQVSLHFASKDAADFLALAKAQAGGLYEKVIPYPQHESLRDSDATKDAILDALDWIMRAVTNTNDVAMVFLSGHGMTTPDQHYRYLPYDYDPDRIERTTISDLELQDYLTKIGGKKIFFFDTCYSGGILGGRAVDSRPDVDKFANELKAAENGIVVFTSSTGTQLSQEKDEWNNGAFTKALIEGLRGAAARAGVPAISISDLEGYVSSRVKELTAGNQRPVMAMPKTVEDYWIAERLN